MRYIINKTNKSLLNKADFIAVQWKDRADILELAYKYENAHIVLDCPMNVEVNEIKRLITESNGRVIYKVHSIDDGRLMRDNGLNFFFDYHLKTFQELRATVEEFKAGYVLLDAPLFHQIDKVRQFGAAIILEPALAISNIYEKGDGATGHFIRPEDARLYEDCIFTFGNCDSNRESTLYKIYQDGKWSGRLDMIVEDLQSECENRLVVSDFGERRANCGMTCMEPGIQCHLCRTVLGLASKKEKIKEYKEAK